MKGTHSKMNLNLLRAEQSFFVIFVLSFARGELSFEGKNVCRGFRTLSHTKYDLEWETVTTQETSWCWRLTQMFRCPVKKKQLRTVPKIVTTTETFPKCCKGYEESFVELGSCSPICPEKCLHGECVQPAVCLCFPGYHGQSCEMLCPENFWGENCNWECDCDVSGYSSCDKVNGKCNCRPGRHGKRCELPCSKGYYGINCNSKCTPDCEVCDAETGLCLDEPTTSTQVPTTTEPTTVEIFTTQDTTTDEINYSENTNEILDTTTSTVDTTKFENSSTTKTQSSAKEIKVGEEIFRRVQEDLSVDTNKDLGVVTDIPITTSTIEDSLKWRKVSEVDSSAITDGTKSTAESGDNEISPRPSNGLKMMNFIPTLTVLTGVSILVFFIAGRWFVVYHKRKARKTETKTVLYSPREEDSSESILCIKTFTENQAFAADSNINDPVPVLLTFKPLNTSDAKPT